MFQFHNELSQESLIFFECSSKQQYDHFQPNNHMLNYICEKSDLFSVIIRMAEENQENFALYTEAIRNLPPAVSEKEAALKKYKYKRYAKIETKLVEDAYLTPVLYPDYFLEYSYRSPQGRNFYHNTVRFYFGKIQDLYEQALHLEKSKQSREYQRSLMTPKLRYEIMTRDGHRCVICGRDASDGVKLHVDHIVPVSKGGMTVASNLRTLCEECNLGKGARYDEDGIN
ncbi:MAG: HNH endonuclease [Clostridia bacterium]|nr:HNH endonuclease [Clostridia bacterium]